MTPNQFLGAPLTANYRPSVIGPAASWQDQRGWFTWRDVRLMGRDPRIRLGLRVLRAPLHAVTWNIKCNNPAEKEFAERMFRKAWKIALDKITRHLEFGASGGEVVYEQSPTTGLIELAEVRDAMLWDMRPLQLSGQMCGLKVRGLQGDDSGEMVLSGPRWWWCAHSPEFGQFYGRSRLAGAWESWREKTGRHGAKDIRRLWYIKNALRGGKMRHPAGMIEDGAGGLRSCQDYAREVIEKVESGGVMTLPNATDPETGKYLWDYEDPQVNGELRDVRDYTKDLDKEMMEGMEIPNEIIEAAESGSGWAGRSVPFLVWLAGEDQIADEALNTIDRHMVRPLCTVNFGAATYEVERKSLVPPAQAPEAGGAGKPAVGGDAAAGDTGGGLAAPPRGRLGGA